MSLNSHWLHSSGDNAFAISPDHSVQSKLLIFCAQFSRNTGECALRPRDKRRRLFRTVGSLIPFHNPIKRRAEFTSSVAEVASRFADRSQLTLSSSSFLAGCSTLHFLRFLL
jgi:hypothetical protein